ncbi:MAG: hypothetical protein ACOCTH_03045 [Halodesulfurarchaeum sp.]
MSRAAVSELADEGDETVTRQDIRDLHGLIKNQNNRLAELESIIEKKDDRIDELEERIFELEAEVDELDDRTDLLTLTQQSDEVDGERMQAALIQHLYEEARYNQENMGKRPVASVDRDDAMRALQYPDVERTTPYQWMRRAADQIDGKVLQYDGGRLKLNLQVGDLPAQFVTEGEV